MHHDLSKVMGHDLGGDCHHDISSNRTFYSIFFRTLFLSLPRSQTPPKNDTVGNTVGHGDGLYGLLYKIYETIFCTYRYSSLEFFANKNKYSRNKRITRISTGKKAHVLIRLGRAPALARSEMEQLRALRQCCTTMWAESNVNGA